MAERTKEEQLKTTVDAMVNRDPRGVSPRLAREALRLGLVEETKNYPGGVGHMYSYRRPTGGRRG